MTDPYLCVIECSDNYVYIGDTRRLNFGGLIPERIIGLYNCRQNFDLFQLTKAPKNRDLYAMYTKYDIDRIKIVETILADRYCFDRKGGQWYKVHTSDAKHNDWLEDVAKGYAKATKPGDYYASCRSSSLKAEEVDARPVCKHGYPCEVHFSKNGRDIYFDCPVKYIWPNFLPTLERIPCCDFVQPL